MILRVTIADRAANENGTLAGTLFARHAPTARADATKLMERREFRGSVLTSVVLASFVLYGKRGGAAPGSPQCV